MTKRNHRVRLVRLVTAVAVGGSAFQLSGCDPAVRTTLLTGLETTSQSLSNALISAFFLSLQDDTTTDTTGITTN
ncbi:MAG: hypothetical protein ACE5HE_11250 [Phycisphaerae bacterium]